MLWKPPPASAHMSVCISDPQRSHSRSPEPYTASPQSRGGAVAVSGQNSGIILPVFLQILLTVPTFEIIIIINNIVVCENIKHILNWIIKRME